MPKIAATIALAAAASFTALFVGLATHGVQSQGSAAPPPAVPTPKALVDGDMGVIAGKAWACGSTEDALNQILKASDDDEVRRRVVATRSILVVGGMRVKIVGGTMFTRKIRVLTNAEGQQTLHDEQGDFQADPRIGRECWLPMEAIKSQAK